MHRLADLVAGEHELHRLVEFAAHSRDARALRNEGDREQDGAGRRDLPATVTDDRLRARLAVVGRFDPLTRNFVGVVCGNGRTRVAFVVESQQDHRHADMPDRIFESPLPLVAICLPARFSRSTKRFKGSGATTTIVPANYGRLTMVPLRYREMSALLDASGAMSIFPDMKAGYELAHDTLSTYSTRSPPIRGIASRYDDTTPTTFPHSRNLNGR